MKTLLGLLLMVVNLPALAAVALVGTVTNLSTGGTVTPGAGSNRVLACAFGGRTSDTSVSRNPSITAASVGSASLANGQLLEAVTSGTGNGANARASVLYVREANIGVGAQTVSVTWSQTMGATSRISCYTLSGVAQTSTVEATNTRASASGADPWSQSFTVAAGSYQILSAIGGGGGLTATPGAGWTEDDDFSNGNARKFAQSKATASAGSLTWTLDLSSASTGVAAVASFAPTNPPVFSGTVPAQSFVEDSPISPLDLSVYFTGETACAVQTGTLPTGLSINSSTCTISGTPTTPAGATAIVVRGSNTDGTADSNSFNITITAAASAPAFSTPISVLSQTTSQYVIQGATSASATVRFVVCLPGSTAPTVAQVKAGDCTGDVDALAAASDTWNGADSVVLGGSLDLPKGDIYGVATNGGGDSNRSALLSEWLDAPAGYQFTQIASIAANSWIADVNTAGASPAIAVGDIIKIVLLSDPTLCPVTQEADGNAILGSEAVPCTIARQKLLYGIWDLSTGTWMTPNPANLWLNATPPIGPPPNALRFYFQLGQVVNQSLVGVCDSPHGDALTYESVSGMPGGIAIVGTAITGTTSEAGNFPNLTWRCLDEAGAYTDFE
jgi:hypothetical protein